MIDQETNLEPGMRAAYWFPGNSEGMEAHVDANQVREYLGMKSSQTKCIMMPDTQAATIRCQNHSQCVHLQP